MITVDCKDVLPIQYELSVHVADRIEAIPAIKHNEFILSPIEHEDQIEYEQVTRTIKEYLDSIGEGSNFTIVTDSKKVLIKSINGKKINRITPSVKSMRTCCGL
jgi:hypothetical protein